MSSCDLVRQVLLRLLSRRARLFYLRLKPRLKQARQNFEKGMSSVEAVPGLEKNLLWVACVEMLADQFPRTVQHDGAKEPSGGCVVVESREQSQVERRPVLIKN